VTEDDAVSAIAPLLGDDCVQTILTATATEPVAAERLVEQCEASRATVYRRLAALKEHDLVREQQRLDPDGHHYEVYAATLDQVMITLTDDGLGLDITRRERMANRFVRLVREM
jgi:Fe2+ or Zn2+ uptake regulation protein